MNIEQKYRDLEAQERLIIKGQAAYLTRNRIILELIEEGQRKIDITRRLNALRKKCDAPLLTADAIGAIEKRLGRQRPGDAG